MPISEAYMFKGTSLIFVLLLSALIFGEAIMITNIIGAVIIIVGIVMHGHDVQATGNIFGFMAAGAQMLLKKGASISYDK